MNKRDLFSELSSAIEEARSHDQGKLTLKTHQIDLPIQLVVSPEEIKKIREK